MVEPFGVAVGVVVVRVNIVKVQEISEDQRIERKCSSFIITSDARASLQQHVDRDLRVFRTLEPSKRKRAMAESKHRA